MPEGVAPLPCEIVLHPDLQTYIANFGTQKGDFAMGEEVDGKIVGMAWSWIIQDFGHIDNQTPSLSVSLYPKYQNQGIGIPLFKRLLKTLLDNDYQRASLSVQKANYASEWYLKMDFCIVKENAEDYVMVADLKQIIGQ